MIEKLQNDIKDKEHEYMKAYKENQKLHSDLIEERSNGRSNHRGSVMLKSGDMLNSYLDDMPSKKSKELNDEASQLKINQLEKQIEFMRKDKDRLEQEVIQKKSEIQEVKQVYHNRENEQSIKYRDLEIKLETLENEREEFKIKFEERLKQIDHDKQNFLNQKEDEFKQSVNEIREKEEQISQKLQQEIDVLVEESNRRTDDFLQQGVKIDELKDQITVLKENEVKLKNDND